MISLQRESVMNLENAIRGARNPMNSWHKIDSYYNEENKYELGINDLELAVKLCKAGSDHRKFLRQIFVSIDITAPLYWWKEYDTYKVGTTANSTSTMHKIHSRAFGVEDFSYEQMDEATQKVLLIIIEQLESLRSDFNETKDKVYWYSMIQLLPSSYNQMRTCTMTYENLRNIYTARRHHKLNEWHVFCEWIENLPYARELIFG